MKTSIFKTEFSILIIGFILGVICVLIMPFNDVYSHHTLKIIWAIIGFILAFLNVYVFNKRILATIALVLVGLTLAQILRIAIEIKLDLSSHNLAGIEVILVNTYLIVASVIGGVIGYFLKIKKKNHQHNL